jgi:hypothetical protein
VRYLKTDKEITPVEESSIAFTETDRKTRSGLAE